MAKGSTKKPGEPKCRGSRSPIEGRDWVKVGGSKWLREVAESQGKFIPREYRDGRNPHRDRARAAEEAPPKKAAAPAPETPPEEGLLEDVEGAAGETYGEAEA